MPDIYFNPDKIVFLTLTNDERVDRLKAQGRSSELWKAKPSEFQNKINRAYLRVAKDYDIPLLSAAGSIEDVFVRLKGALSLI
jgi:thymidylate kinase